MANYNKPPLTFSQQADQLISRGLKSDKDQLVEKLKAVNYYRLSAYLHPFRAEDSSGKKLENGDFISKTNIDEIWDRYCFDNKLRMLCLDAIGRVEVAVRTQLAYHFAHDVGTFAYVDRQNLPRLFPAKIHQEWVDRLEAERQRSKEKFVEHFDNKYGNSHTSLPIWMMVELMSFGTTLTFYKGVDKAISNKVADEFDVPNKVLQNWLLVLNTIC